MSESRSSTVALIVAPAFDPDAHRPFVLATTPGRTLSLTFALAKKASASFEDKPMFEDS